MTPKFAHGCTRHGDARLTQIRRLAHHNHRPHSHLHT